jgi:hypothetical protein
MRDDGICQILRLFDTATDGLKEEQFYAMLRLIAHAQNGRRVTPELVHLGGKLAFVHMTWTARIFPRSICLPEIYITHSTCATV